MLEVSGESQGKSQFFNLFKLTIKDLEIKQEMRVVLVVGWVVKDVGRMGAEEESILPLTSQ